MSIDGVALGVLLALVVVVVVVMLVALVVVAAGGVVIETAVGVGDWHPTANASANRTTGRSRI